MPIENVTPNRGYQLPNAANDLVDDVARIIAGLHGVDLDMANALAALLTKSDKDHEHVIADIIGLSAALSARQEIVAKGQANGYASLGSDGKVPAAQLPSTVFGALSYQGAWNASTNSPTIPAANSANKGHYYKVSVAGTTTVSGINDWEVGDWIVSNGTTWDKIDNTDQVLSVAGLRGAITAAALKAALAIAVADITGLGNSATRNVGTAANTVAAGNDSRLVGALQKAGGTMTGPIVLSGAPNSDLHAATKKYVDDNSAKPSNKRIYTSSGTWSKPAGLTKVVVTCLGAGGGSGGTRSVNSIRGGGGGGGAFAQAEIAAGSLSATVVVAVGAGGTAGVGDHGDGGAGGSSSFGSYCSASGGGGGTGSTTTVGGTGGAGGSAATGDIRAVGFPGETNAPLNEGGGDSALFRAPPRTAPTFATGTGAACAAGQGGGVAGKSGFVIVEEYF